jgi:NAD(P)-dependent dehydrogenase (short-subunit alcohol dehydrogenase family)
MAQHMIAVVTGASRGSGKGVALALGRVGATVYVTGRSTRGDESPVGGTVAETAEAVTRAGGNGIAVAVDHFRDDEVAALFGRVRGDHGRLDILVNNAALLRNSTGPGSFWEKSLDEVDLITVGLRSHYVAAWHAAPLLIANGKGLIVNTGHYGAVSYFVGPVYGAQKAGADKMAADMARELRPHNVSTNGIWMGSVATERGKLFRDSVPAEQRHLLREQESAEFTGRVIAALYASPERMALSGQALIGAEIGERLGVVDIDGRQPPSHRETMGGPPILHPSLTV